jgi:serine protease
MSKLAKVMVMFLCALSSSAALLAQSSEKERYIVAFKQDLGPNSHAALRAAGAITALELPEHRAVAAYMRPEAANGLASNPNVDYVEVDEKRYPLAWTNSSSGGETTPYGIKAVEANLLGAGASIGSCTVCIIDSGYFINHDDNQNGNVIAAPQGAENVFEDGCGHGTHVAGTIAALTGNGTGVVGVNGGGNLNLVISRVFNNSCGWAYASSLVKALDACKAKRGANKMVVSMSLGGSFKNRTEDQAFAKAYTEGILSIAAAGNGGNSRLSYPAGYSSVVSVAAIDANEAKGSFSQFNSDVEIAAPGVAVLSTVPWIGSAITVDSVKYLASQITNSAATDGVSGGLVNGGLCDSAGSWAGQTVLCQRGTVSFKTKVDNVKAGGGVAAVIYNNVPGGFAGTCDDGTGTTCAGVGIGISKEDGEFLVANKLSLTATTTASVSSNCGDGNTIGCGYEAWDGTSMATPHVSSVAALIWSYDTSKTNAQVRDAMNKTAKDLGAAGRDNSFGYGLVKALRAKDCLLGTGPCTPSTAPLP